MTAEDFESISDYLDPNESTSDRLIVRAQPSTIAGYYLILICNQRLEQFPAGTKLSAKIRHSNDSELLEFERTLAPAPNPKSREIYVGITESEGQISQSSPIAWVYIKRA